MVIKVCIQLGLVVVYFLLLDQAPTTSNMGNGNGNVIGYHMIVDRIP
jgi:hypothetical protein